ncbi:MAG TPA: rhomboid family intramembrane serine protease [Kiritimatiellia bacterium]|nr:rhomboid family intramembrane serine protease [Kiritimatiellia bacterium]
MRDIGKIQDEEKAKLFCDYLFNQGINSHVEKHSDGAWVVWVEEEDRLDEATQRLAEFESGFDKSKFIEGASGADDRRKAQEKNNKEYAKKMRTGADVFNTYGIAGMGKITFVLIALSVIATLLTNFGKNDNLFQRIAIAETFTLPGEGRVYYRHLLEVRNGEVWRLVTPIFVHFNLLHILFNMMWLRDLGSAVEHLRRIRFYLLFILIVSIASNVGQFYMSGPGFGGMSGVVYALLGYVWMQSRFNPWSGFVLHSMTVQMMLVWFFLCLSGLVGNIANTAHAVGLAAGIVWGYIDARRRVPE